LNTSSPSGDAPADDEEVGPAALIGEHLLEEGAVAVVELALARVELQDRRAVGERQEQGVEVAARERGHGLGVGRLAAAAGAVGRQPTRLQHPPQDLLELG
jgi:hypothetical protein